MSAVDEGPLIDKTGWSSMCQRGEHAFCASAGARCSCSCHGKAQQPRRPQVSITEPTPPTPLRPFACECGESFHKAAGLAIHRGRAHGPKKPKAAKPAPKPAPVAAPPEPKVEPWLLVIGPERESLVLSSKADAAAVAALLRRRGDEVLLFRLADGAS